MTKHYADVKDFRVERYLPAKATNITVDKMMQGHRAKYSISETDLRNHIAELWKRADRKPERPLDDVVEKQPDDWFAHRFRGLNWDTPKLALEMNGPYAPNGAGATYFYDRSTGTGYHYGGYW